MAEVDLFGTLPDGSRVMRVTLSGGGLRASVLTYGARLQDLRLAGHDHPLVLGADDLAPYLGPMEYFGATVGRYANRLAGGCFPVGERIIGCDRNENGETCLHGGSDGMACHNWGLVRNDPGEVLFSLNLPDGHMGFPGNLQASVTYRLLPGTLEIEMTARCDQDSPISLANHSYFNLDDSPDVGRHLLTLNAEHYLPVDGRNIPTGRIAPVENTPYDFRQPHPLSQMDGTPLDHNFCLSNGRGQLHPAATLTGTSGITMTVQTDAPGLQVYNGAHFNGITGGIGDRVYGPGAGLALETQEWPDAPNHPGFPSPLLPAGHQYRNLVRIDLSA